MTLRFALNASRYCIKRQQNIVDSISTLPSPARPSLSFPSHCSKATFRTMAAHNTPSTRLIRFVSKDDGNTYYGRADAALQEAEALTGGSPFSTSIKSTRVRHPISRLLSPLARDDCRGIVCIGLNYRDHAEEAKMAIPTIPVVL